MHFYAFLTRCICAYCSACWFRCILIQLHFNAFARLRSSDAFRIHSLIHSPSEAHPVHAACFHVSLALSPNLSPLGFSCVCLCGPRVWRICAHTHACWGIFLHSHASWSSHEASIMLSSRPRGASKSGNVPLSWTGIRIYAHECIIVRMHQNATH